MELTTILPAKNQHEFRSWLDANYLTSKDVWIPNLQRGKPIDNNKFYYIDAVYVALCFGWIDSTFKKVDGVLYQRFSPRRKNSNWTVLNIARIKYLDEHHLMNEVGFKYLPKIDYNLDEEIIKDIKDNNIYDIFISMPRLYQFIKISNLKSIKNNSIDKYKISLDNLIKYTKQNKTIGEWDDYGRLSQLEI